MSSLKGTDLVCPVCGAGARCARGSEVWPGYFATTWNVFWVCINFPKCYCYAGAHAGTGRPLAQLAPRPLRNARIKAHAALDRLWKADDGTLKRAQPGCGHFPKRYQVYKALAQHFGAEEVHIGWMNEADCRRTEEWAVDMFIELMMKAGA